MAHVGIKGRIYCLDNSLQADDCEPILQQVTLRATSFGDSSMLKSMGEVFINVKTSDWIPGTYETLTVEYATELRNAYNFCTTGTLKGPVSDDALNSLEISKRAMLRYAAPAKKFQYVQIRVTMNSAQRLALSGITYKVGGLNAAGKGTAEAAD
jgi:hypothetical protein